MASSVVSRAGVGGSGVAGGQDAPHHGGQVGGEQDRGAEALLHLGGVAVVEQAVGDEVLVDGGEVEVRPWAPARPPTRRWPRRRPAAAPPSAGQGEDAGLDQRGEGQERRPSGSSRARRSRVAPTSRPGGARAGRRRSVSSRSGARCSSPYQVGYSAGSAQAEVGGQVDDDPDPVDQVGHQVLGLAVGQGQEHHVEAVEGGGVGRAVDEGGVGGGQRRGVGGHRLAGVAPGCGHRHLEIGVAGAQAQQLGAAVAGGADDSRPSWVIPTSCKSMRILA